MTVTVRIGDRSFVVEVGDLHTRPIIATVDGHRIEVWTVEPNSAAPAPAPVAAAGQLASVVAGGTLLALVSHLG